MSSISFKPYQSLIYLLLPSQINYRVFRSRFLFNLLLLLFLLFHFFVCSLSLSWHAYVCVCVCLYRLSLCSLAYDTVMMYFIATTKPKQSTNSTQRNVMARPQTALYRVASSTRPLPNLCPAQNGNRRHCKFSVPSFRSPSFFCLFLAVFGCWSPPL